MTPITSHRGGCHCGALSWTLRSALAPEHLPARACQCGFCLRHGALTTSDPAGELRFACAAPAEVLRYRFATGSAEFLVCARCGVYCGALMEEGGRWYGIANLNTIEGRERLAPSVQPFDYDGETEALRRARRSARWTPAGPLAAFGATPGFR